MAANDARSDELGLVALKQWRKFIKTGHGWTGSSDDIEVSYSEAGLNRIDIDRLQELRLKQLACTGDLVPRNIPDKYPKESGGTSDWPDPGSRISQFP